MEENMEKNETEKKVIGGDNNADKIKKVPLEDGGGGTNGGSHSNSPIVNNTKIRRTLFKRILDFFKKLFK